MLKITYTNTAGKVLRKTRKHKESEVKNRKIKNKNGLAKLVMTSKYKELKIISKYFNWNPNNHFLRTAN